MRAEGVQEVNNFSELLVLSIGSNSRIYLISLHAFHEKRSNAGCSLHFLTICINLLLIRGFRASSKHLAQNT